LRSGFHLLQQLGLPRARSGRPFDSMARAYIELLIVRNEEYKERYFEAEINLYKIDGMIFHDAKTCPNNSNNRYGMPERLSKKFDMPMLVLHGDLNDLRCYSEEQARTISKLLSNSWRRQRAGESKHCFCRG